MSNVIPIRPRLVPLRTRRPARAGQCRSVYWTRRKRWARVMEANGWPKCELSATDSHAEGHVAGALRWGRPRGAAAPAQEAS